MKLTWRQKFSLVILIVAVGAGAFQYLQGTKIPDTDYNLQAKSDDMEFGDAVYVSANKTSVATANPTTAATEMPKSEDAFDNSKYERDNLRSEALDKLTNSFETATTSKSKEAAHQDLLKFNATTTLEDKTELMIKEKGYGDAIVTIAEDQSIDALLRMPVTKQQDAILIADVISSQTKTKISNIHIRSVK